MSKKMNILLDLGGHKLQGVKTLFDKKEIDSNYIIYTYEANPYVYKELTYEAKALEEQNKVKIFTFNLAVSDVDGEVFFNVDEYGLDSMGCNLLENPVNVDPVYGSKYNWKKIKVPSVSLYTIFENFKQYTFEKIKVKMDIEGAEYSVLPQLIELKNLFNITHLYIEWHDRLFYPNHKEKQKEMVVLKQILNKKNIEIIDLDYILL